MEEREYTLKAVKKALEKKQITKVEFYSDGSGARFYTNNAVMGLSIDLAIKAISGYRFQQHELTTCM